MKLLEGVQLGFIFGKTGTTLGSEKTSSA